MARVTVEDCLANVKNRFELVIIASKRARQLMRGTTEPKVAWENDKATVVALREIAMGYTDFNDTHHHHESLSEPSAQTGKQSPAIESDVAFNIDETPETSETADSAQDSSTHETSTSGNTPDSE